jgi:hypothetical protein
MTAQYHDKRNWDQSQDCRPDECNSAEPGQERAEKGSY